MKKGDIEKFRITVDAGDEVRRMVLLEVRTGCLSESAMNSSMDKFSL